VARLPGAQLPEPPPRDYFTSVVHDTNALAAKESGDTGRQVAYFAMGAVIMLGIVGLVLPVVARRPCGRVPTVVTSPPLSGVTV
jgi:hypothetical protein